MDDLAERVERAEGPSRELDREIAPLLGLRVVDEGHPLGRVCYDERNHSVALPAYTASIDAAMTLVPEGCHWSVHSGGGAHIWKGGDYYADLSEYGAAATPALALIAAALRAREG